MKRSESIKEIATALSKCQSTLKDVFKGTEGYGYKYATLDAVYDEIRPKMTECGLSLTHEKSYNKETDCVEVASLLMHISGEWIEYYGSLPFVTGKNKYQDAGSGYTYLERYQTSAIFAITADSDNDGEGSGNSKDTISDENISSTKKLADYTTPMMETDSIAEYNKWVKANWVAASTDLSNTDMTKLGKACEEWLKVLEEKVAKQKPKSVLCPMSSKESLLTDCQTSDCFKTCQIAQEAII